MGPTVRIRLPSVQCRTSWAAAVVLLAWALMLAAAPGAAAQAGDPAASAAKLKALRARIAELRDSLGKDRERQGTLSRQLHATEQKMAELGTRLHDLDGKLKAHSARLATLKRKRGKQQAALAKLRDSLARQVRAAYMMGRQQQLKLLLNQQDPAKVGRVLVYYRYLSQARAQQIDAAREHLHRLASIEQSIQAETDRLSKLRDSRADERRQLTDQRDRRTAVLAKLEKRIHGKRDRLARMNRDAQRLERLVRQLRHALSDIPPEAGRKRPFRQLRGKLPWPAAGQITARYGQRRDGPLRWHGVFIAAPAGEPVHAVARGRVAFADWLRGFGLLLIIDHGHGYMSLYGHNQSLLKQVGDWVEAGDTVALTGDSGGVAHSGVYFELRADGHTINPSHWCRGDPRRRSASR